MKFPLVCDTPLQNLSIISIFEIQVLSVTEMYAFESFLRQFFWVRMQVSKTTVHCLRSSVRYRVDGQ